MMNATISYSLREQICLHIGAWDDPDRVYLPGFANVWDAWAFCICNGLDDPLPDRPDNKKYTLRPPVVEPEQMDLFSENPVVEK